MVFLSSMLSAFIASTWYDSGMIYAFIIGFFAEIIYLSYTYNLIKKSEAKLRDKYNAIINSYKEREILYEQQKAQNEKSITALKKKNEEKENLLEYEKQKTIQTQSQQDPPSPPEPKKKTF